MVRLALPVVGAAALVAVLGSPPDAGAERRACSQAGSRTIVASKHVRVFRSRRDRHVYGCLFSRGVPVALTSDDDFSATSLASLKPRLAGRFVGFAYSWDNGVTGGPGVEITDLRRGRARGVELDPGSSARRGARPDPDATIHDIVITSRGSLAWTWTADYFTEPGQPKVREVRKLAPTDRRRLGVLLDSGPEIEVDSLTRRRSAVSWINAGQRVSAPLR